LEISISVRNLVEFILRDGDIDNRRATGSENAMQEGSRIHRMIQKRMGSDYKAEVWLSEEIDCGNYRIIVEGRADGVIDRGDAEPDVEMDESNSLTELSAGIVVAPNVIIDEIKATYRELNRIKEPVTVHLAQAKCYAYIYAKQNHQNVIGVRMTYCNIDTEEIKYFHYNYTFGELSIWFNHLMTEYQKWADFSFEWKQKRQASAKALEFPFAYREGQKQLAGYVYTTLSREKKLFIQAPTGVGKTISTVFPAVKAIGEEKGDKIFYLTAKTITRTVAQDTFQILRKKGLQFKTVVLTAKDKICFQEETACNPEACPYAKGHFERINDAIYDLLTSEDSFDRETIEEYAIKHNVCPFEMSLDMSLFSDGIICDYNYLFDPYVYLHRFFSEGVKGDYFFLIDEAHNLVERGREMYSAKLIKEDFLTLKKLVKPYSVKIEKHLEKCNKELLKLKKECESIQIILGIGSFTMALTRLHSVINDYLEDHEDSPVKDEILEFYFEISRFLDVYERVDENYVTYTEYGADGSFMIKEFCVNPAKRLQECMERGRGSILFSATFLPIQYYKKLLGGTEEDYEVYAHSNFDPSKRGIFIGNEVTSKYTRRGKQEYYNIANYIYEITRVKQGNYMIFFPSHQFLEEVYESYMDYFYEEKNVECIRQRDFMTEADREDFLSRFAGESDFDFSKVINMEVEIEERSLLGFCVLGGIFSEGIDLTHDKLIGAIIVGTGLPQVCHERELLKSYFDEMGENGFDYAYKYPGMNKVLQSAGRVIRTAEDVGIVALLDERFLNTTYKKMFPREWEHFEIMSIRQSADKVERFWKN